MLPLAVAALTTAGHIYGQSQQQKFQERMSNTAAQRSVMDYRKAGLNPALAYDRSASSPQGTSIGGALESGVNSALSYSRYVKEREMADAQQNYIKAQEEESKTRSSNLRVEGEILDRQKRHLDVTQPHDQRIRKAEAELNELLLPEARNNARIAELLGTGGTAIGRGLSAAARLAPIISAFRKGPAKIIRNINLPPLTKK